MYETKAPLDLSLALFRAHIQKNVSINATTDSLGWEAIRELEEERGVCELFGLDLMGHCARDYQTGKTMNNKGLAYKNG